MNLKWVTAHGGGWLPFQDLDLSRVSTVGIYVIWYDGNPGRVVYVGQGDIRAKLMAHRSDPIVMSYAQRGTLRVTWAAVSAHQRDGVERYLADLLTPLCGYAHPQVTPIAVNW